MQFLPIFVVKMQIFGTFHKHHSKKGSTFLPQKEAPFTLQTNIKRITTKYVIWSQIKLLFFVILNMQQGAHHS
jgi:hypothetical protein